MSFFMVVFSIHVQILGLTSFCNKVVFTLIKRCNCQTKVKLQELQKHQNENCSITYEKERFTSLSRKSDLAFDLSC